jgi:hypothetical protein
MPREPALEGVAVRARHARQRQPAVERPRRVAWLDRGDQTIAVEADATVALDSAGRENMLETQVA